MNFEATARSNYFRVKDEAAFKAWAERIGVEVYEDTEQQAQENGRPLPAGEKQFMIARSDGNGWPVSYLDRETQEDVMVDLPAELAKHLHDDDVAILMEIGAEGLRCVTGYALAVNAAGVVKSVSLEGIYELALWMGNRVTRADY